MSGNSIRKFSRRVSSRLSSECDSIEISKIIIDCEKYLRHFDKRKPATTPDKILPVKLDNRLKKCQHVRKFDVKRCGLTCTATDEIVKKSLPRSKAFRKLESTTNGTVRKKPSRLTFSRRPLEIENLFNPSQFNPQVVSVHLLNCKGPCSVKSRKVEDLSLQRHFEAKNTQTVQIESKDSSSQTDHLPVDSEVDDQADAVEIQVVKMFYQALGISEQSSLLSLTSQNMNSEVELSAISFREDSSNSSKEGDESLLADEVTMSGTVNKTYEDTSFILGFVKTPLKISGLVSNSIENLSTAQESVHEGITIGSSDVERSENSSILKLSSESSKAFFKTFDQKVRLQNFFSSLIQPENAPETFDLISFDECSQSQEVNDATISLNESFFEESHQVIDDAGINAYEKIENIKELQSVERVLDNVDLISSNDNLDANGSASLFLSLIALREFEDEDDNGFDESIETLVQVSKPNFFRVYIVRKLLNKKDLWKFCLSSISRRSKFFQLENQNGNNVKGSVNVRRLTGSELKKIYQTPDSFHGFNPKTVEISNRFTRNEKFTVETIDEKSDKTEIGFLKIDIEVLKDSNDSSKFTINKAE